MVVLPALPTPLGLAESNWAAKTYTKNTGSRKNKMNLLLASGSCLTGRRREDRSYQLRLCMTCMYGIVKLFSQLLLRTKTVSL